MSASGKSQREIAKHFGRSERAIRNWLKEAQRRRLIAFRGMTPEQMLAASETKLLSMQSLLLQKLAAVQSTDDNRGIAALVREIRSLEIDRYRLREIAGYFGGVRWHHTGNDPDDRAVQGANVLLEMIRETFAPAGEPDSFRVLPAPSADDDGDDDDIL
jgi:transposase-like protein